MTKSSSLLVAHLGEQRFGAIDDVAGKQRLFGEHRVDFLLDGSTTDKFMYQDVSFLSNPKRPISSLVFDGGVPPAVEVNDVGGGGQVQSGAAGLEREDEEGGPVLALKALDEALPLGDGGPAVQHEAGPPEHSFEKLGKRAGDLAELGEDERLLLTFGKLFAERSQALKLAAMVRRVVARATKLGRMIADLLELHELGQDEPSAFHAVGLLQASRPDRVRPFHRGRPARGSACRRPTSRPFRAGRR